MHISNSENLDPAFRYEALARFAFDNCYKYGDPWKYAAQEVFGNFTPLVELKGKRILSTILQKLIYDNKDLDISKDLMEIENSVWEITSQKDAIEIIDKTLEILKKL